LAAKIEEMRMNSSNRNSPVDRYEINSPGFNIKPIKIIPSALRGNSAEEEKLPGSFVSNDSQKQKELKAVSFIDKNLEAK
jgi:hypothetical protein